MSVTYTIKKFDIYQLENNKLVRKKLFMNTTEFNCAYPHRTVDGVSLQKVNTILTSDTPNFLLQMSNGTVQANKNCGSVKFEISSIKILFNKLHLITNDGVTSTEYEDLVINEENYKYYLDNENADVTIVLDDSALANAVSGSSAISYQSIKNVLSITFNCSPTYVDIDIIAKISKVGSEDTDYFYYRYKVSQEYEGE